jgi:HlyD family secretion protein
LGWKRWVLIGVVLTGVVLALLFGFRDQPALVEMAEVKRGPLRITIEEEGKTRVTDRFVVSAPLAGYMRRITLKEGDTILQGQVIARLEPLLPAALDPRSRAEAEARVSAAQSSVAAARERVRAAQADARYSKDELARVEQLVKSGDIPRERYDRALVEERRANAALSEAQQQIEVAEAEVRAARAALLVSPQARTGETIAVRSPVSGRVLKVVRDSEGVVNSGEALVELGSVRSLEVIVDL